MSTWDDLRNELELTEQACGILHGQNQDLERQLEERNQAHLELHADYNTKHSECEGLKVQLAEAREEVKFVARMIKLTLSHNMSDYEAIMAIDNKLKEQGDE